MTQEHRKSRHVPTHSSSNPNISTENQPEGAARRPSDTLDREPDRDPLSGGAIPSNYDPAAMTRKGEQGNSRAGRQGAGVNSRQRDDHE